MTLWKRGSPKINTLDWTLGQEVWDFNLVGSMCCVPGQDTLLTQGLFPPSRLSWCDPASGKGFSLEYPSISLHAISRDTSQFPQECIYCMMDSPLDVDPMFKALSDCQVLHPDPEDEEGQGEDEDFFCDAEEGELSEEGQATLERLEGILQMPSQEEFVQMTSTSNGLYLNGHSNVPADDEMEPNAGNDEQFEDADK
ncbi:Methylosome subunit pICln [Stylophora pistillata]|uniref:Methylosome subunit pICln n=1 Tax=Stylophora pistillata TaxID=50429 RepID=A0A2B4RQQ8_STYPI|nr:Methylosome subunit pICln [Stylophora pistillata]